MRLQLQQVNEHEGGEAEAVSAATGEQRLQQVSKSCNIWAKAATDARA
jgi:hypothetical protein